MQVVDILRGANTRAVKDKGHDSLPEHGACKALRFLAIHHSSTARQITPHRRNMPPLCMSASHPVLHFHRRRACKRLGHLHFCCPTPLLCTRYCKAARVRRSKGDALRLLRRLVVLKVLTEETYRQDNQYGGVLSYLAVNEPVARGLAHGSLTIKMPFPVSLLVC